MRKILIYGAGSAGRTLCKRIVSQGSQIPAFIDDNPQIQGRLIQNIPIYSLDQVIKEIDYKSVEAVIIAIPSLGYFDTLRLRNKILKYFNEVLTVPPISEMIVSARDWTISDFDVDKIIGRCEQPIDDRVLTENAYVLGKRVLVTGAGGSIGSELCKQLVMQKPSTLILLDHSEFSLYRTNEEISGLINGDYERYDGQIETELCSVTDQNRLVRVFERHRPDLVIHAAAYKHVSLAERNPESTINNNVFGTLTLLEVAQQFGKIDFVLVSTDKAVRPTSVMGASKRACELIVRSFGNRSDNQLKTSVVRFGNVLGSSGSVIPKFLEQIRSGGPVTVTHPEVTRYFMTIPEACHLILMAASMAKGSEIFLLDMGEPQKITQVAERLIKTAGLRLSTAATEGDIEIEYTGVAPGEKLVEELLVDDSSKPTVNPKIYEAIEAIVEWDILQSQIFDLQNQLNQNDLKKLIKDLFDITSTSPCIKQPYL